SRHDPDLAVAGLDEPGAVGADQTRLPGREGRLDADHVGGGDPLGDADRQPQPGVRGLEDGVGGGGRRDEDHRGLRPRLRDRLPDSVEDRDALVHGAAAAGRDAGDDPGAVLEAAARVERPLPAGDPLDDDARLPIDQDAHRAPASATTFRAASSIPSARVKSRPDSLRMRRPSSTLVPSRRATTGTRTATFWIASTSPRARTSTRRMPPKMLIRTAFTLGSESRILNADATCSEVAPPPTSRKLAGSPPTNLMMSMVAIARPAPFTMHPTVPC